MNDNEISHKRSSDDLDADIKVESDSNSNNHHNLESDDLQPDEQTDSSQPPVKKVRTSEELDIRFLVSSKVSSGRSSPVRY